MHTSRMLVIFYFLIWVTVWRVCSVAEILSSWTLMIYALSYHNLHLKNIIMHTVGPQIASKHVKGLSTNSLLIFTNI